MLLRACLIFALLYTICLAGTQGVGAWYARHSAPLGLESALRWDPANPQYFDDFGTATHIFADNGRPDRILASYQRATALSPENAFYWSDLGAAYDWAGRPTDAIAAFHKAQRLYPNAPEINWRVANFLVRQGKTAEALGALRRVLLGGSVSRQEVFALATTATQDNEQLLAEVIPAENSILFDYLNFQIANNDIRAAEEVWKRITDLNLPFRLPNSFPYLDALIQHREVDQADHAWTWLGERFPSELQGLRTERNLVTNGNFEHAILNGGFDWRVLQGNGAVIGLDEENACEGMNSLRIDFDSTENLYFYHVFQYIRVRPQTRYRFSGYIRVKDVTTDSGPLFEIYDPYDMKALFISGKSVVGTADWSLQQLPFTTGRNTKLIVLRVGRHPSEKIANRIGGTTWIDKITVEPAD